MTKHHTTKPKGLNQREVPITTAPSGGKDFRAPPHGDIPTDENLHDGDAVVLGLGGGASGSSASKQRKALMAAANKGDANAQCTMGDVCRTGDKYTTQDLSEALRWYRLAADQGDPNAQNNLGAMYHNGMGAPIDIAEAAKWYRPAAEQGLAIAQYNVGLLCLWGTGIPQDELQAADWLHKAASQGHIEACCDLGTMYRFGRGVEKRISTAAEFHVIAALEGDVTAIGNLAEYAAEIEAEALGGRMLAALCLAKMYDRGLGVEKNPATMYLWLLWGNKYGNRDEDPDAAEELDDMREFYAMVISDSDKTKAKRLVTQMHAGKSSVDQSKPKRQRFTKKIVGSKAT